MKYFLLLLLMIVILPSVLGQNSNANYGTSYSIGMNAWIGSENDDDSGTPVEGLVDDASYHFQLSYKFPTNKERGAASFVKAVQQYISVRALKFRSHVEGSEDYSWVESLQATGAVYGRRYFVREDYKGFNFGWYLGLALAKTDGYEWPSNFPDFPEKFNEDLILPLNAGEMSYHLEYRAFFVEPTFTIYINSENFNFEYFPSIIAGFQFK